MWHNGGMGFRIVTAVLVGLAALATGQAGALAGGRLPAKVDIAPVKDKLHIYHDGAGHFLAVIMATDRRSGRLGMESLFYGDGKRFYRQLVSGFSRHGSAIRYAVSDPRMRAPTDSMLERDKDGRVTYRCARRVTELTRLSPRRERRLRDRATFHDVYWRHLRRALARDDEGRYYYVDCLRTRKTNPWRRRGAPRGCRVFVGPRGKMKRVRLRNVASDSGGEVFVTAAGTLKLTRVKGRGSSARFEAAWRRGKQTRSLTWLSVSVDRNRLLIHRELGVYLGKRFWRPCDDLR